MSTATFNARAFTRLASPNQVDANRCSGVYLLVSTERMQVDHFTRQDRDYRLLAQYQLPGQIVALTGLGCELPLAEIYEQVAFPPE